LKTGALALTRDLYLQVDNEKTQKKQGRLDQLHLLAAILAQWQRLVTSNKALNLLYQAMCAVLYSCTAVAIKMASLFGTFFCCPFVCCCPGGCWGNTEQVVARWQHPVASGVALDMLHQAMCFVLHQQTAMAIKTDDRQGTFDRHQQFCHRHKLSFLT
jgi:hypothetical protein